MPIWFWAWLSYQFYSRQNGPNGFLIVIELNPELLTAALLLRDQTKIFDDCRFRLIFGDDEVDVSRKISDEMERLTEGDAEQLEVLFH